MADYVVLTSDNPRSEDPLLIMADALVGSSGRASHTLRKSTAASPSAKPCEEAREGDMVVLAGKGHETYQVLKDGKVDFDDRKVAREALAEMGYK